MNIPIRTLSKMSVLVRTLDKMIVLQGGFGIFQGRGVAFGKKGGDYSCLITKISELGACFSYFSYVLAQNEG